jgi:hypothetical protein
MRTRRCDCKKCDYCEGRDKYERHLDKIIVRRAIRRHLEFERRERCRGLMLDFLERRLSLEEYCARLGVESE